MDKPAMDGTKIINKHWAEESNQQDKQVPERVNMTSPQVRITYVLFFLTARQKHIN